MDIVEKGCNLDENDEVSTNNHNKLCFLLKTLPTVSLLAQTANDENSFYCHFI